MTPLTFNHLSLYFINANIIRKFTLFQSKAAVYGRHITSAWIKLLYIQTHIPFFFLLQIILSIWITFQWVGVKKMMIQIKRRSSRATKMERMRTRSNELCWKPNEHTNIFSSTKDYRIDRIHANILLCLKHNLWICT